MKKVKIYFLATRHTDWCPENVWLDIVESKTRKKALAEMKKRYFTPREAETLEAVDFFSFSGTDESKVIDNNLALQTVKGLIVLGHDEGCKGISSHFRALVREIYQAGIRQGKKIKK